jgi:hypothetical protein
MKKLTKIEPSGMLIKTKKNQQNPNKKVVVQDLINCNCAQ